MWTIKETKAAGKTAMKSNYAKCVVVSLIMAFSTRAFATSAGSQAASHGADAAGNTVSPETILWLKSIAPVLFVVFIISVVLDIFVFNPLAAGCRQFFYKNLHETAMVGEITEPLRADLKRTAVTIFLQKLSVFLWGLLFIIPGVIKAYSYRLVPYILADHPEMSAREVLRHSAKLMDGEKLNSFLFDLSFLGWHLLGVLSCGLIEIFYTCPYHDSANAALYQKLLEKEQTLS